jgi:hypothetical protein
MPILHWGIEPRASCVKEQLAYETKYEACKEKTVHPSASKTFNHERIQRKQTYSAGGVIEMVGEKNKISQYAPLMMPC